MSGKITPQQAFEAVRILWPNITHIKSDRVWKWLGMSEHQTCATCNLTGADIDWGDQTQYPPPEPKWRPATVDDAISALKGEVVKARFRDYSELNRWTEAELIGIVRRKHGTKYVASNGAEWAYCEVQQ